MKKINLLDLFKEEDLYVLLDKRFLDFLVTNSKEKLGSQFAITKYLKISSSNIDRWLGKDKFRDTKPRYKDILTLAKLNGIKIDEVNKEIKGIRLAKERKFLSIKHLRIDNLIVRTIAFIIGDGSIENGRIRFSNSEKSIIKVVLNDLINCFAIKEFYVTLVVPKYFDKGLILEKIREWENYLSIRINKIYIKHETSIDGKPFISVKEYVEVALISKTISTIINKILYLIKEESLNDKTLATSYLQGIYAAEGSASYSNKNRLRTVQLKMRDEKEVEYIVMLLNKIGIGNSGLKYYPQSHGAWHVYITGKDNIEKCNKIDLFTINQSRKNKLQELVNSYQRRQSKHIEKIGRYNQVIKTLAKYAVINSLNLSKELDLSLVRTQILLQMGFKEGFWDRFWNGKEFLYTINKNG